MKKYLIFGFRYYSYCSHIDEALLGSEDTLKEAVKFVKKHFNSDDNKDVYNIRDRDTWKDHDELVEKFRGHGC